MSTKKSAEVELKVSSTAAHQRFLENKEVKSYFMEAFGHLGDVVEITNTKRDFIDFGTVGDLRLLFGSIDDAKVDFKKNPTVPSPKLLVPITHIKALLKNETNRRVFESRCRSGALEVRGLSRKVA